MIENPRKVKKKKPAKKAPTRSATINTAFDVAFDGALSELKQKYIDSGDNVLFDSIIKLSIGKPPSEIQSKEPLLDLYRTSTVVFMAYMSGELQEGTRKSQAIMTEYFQFITALDELVNRDIPNEDIFRSIAEVYGGTLSYLTDAQKSVVRRLYPKYVKAISSKFARRALGDLMSDIEDSDIRFFIGLSLLSMFIGVTTTPSLHLASEDDLVSTAAIALRNLGLRGKTLTDEERKSILDAGLVKVAYKNKFGRYIDLGDILVAPPVAEPTIINLKDFIDEEKEAEINRQIEEERAAREEEAREAARIAEEEAKAAEEAALAAAREAEEARLEAERVRALEEAERKATLAEARIEAAKEEALSVIEEITKRSYDDNKPSWATFREFVDAKTLTKEAVKAKIEETWELRPVREQRSRAEVSNLVSNVTQPVPTAFEAKAATSTDLPLADLQDAIEEQVGVNPIPSTISDSEVELRVSWSAEKAMEPWGYSFTALYESSGLSDTIEYELFEQKVRKELSERDALEATLEKQQRVAELAAENYTTRNCRAWVVLYLLNNITDMATAKKYGLMAYVDLIPAMTYDEEKEDEVSGRVSQQLNDKLKTVIDTRWEAAINTLSKYESGASSKEYDATLIESYIKIRSDVYAHLLNKILTSYQGLENQLFIMPNDVASLKSYYTNDPSHRHPVYILDEDFGFDSYRRPFGIYSAVRHLLFSRMLTEAKKSQDGGALFTKALSYRGPKARITQYDTNSLISSIIRRNSQPVVANKNILGIEIWKYIKYNKKDWSKYVPDRVVEEIIEKDETLFDYGLLRGPFGMQLKSAKTLTEPQYKLMREMLPELETKYKEKTRSKRQESSQNLKALTEARANIVGVLLDYYSPEELIERNPNFMYRGEEVPLLVHLKEKKEIDTTWLYNFVHRNLGRAGTLKLKKAGRPTSLYLDDERLNALRETLAIYSQEVANAINAYKDFISQSTIKAATDVNPYYYDLANTMHAVISGVGGAILYRPDLPDWINELESTLNAIPTLSQENLNSRIAMVIKAYALNITKYPVDNKYSRIQAMQDTAQTMRLSIEFVKIVTRGLHSKIDASKLDVRTPSPVIYRGRGNPYLDNDIISSLYFNEGISIDNLAAIYAVEEEDIYDILAS